MKETMSCGGENYDLFFLTNQDGLKTSAHPNYISIKKSETDNLASFCFGFFLFFLDNPIADSALGAVVIYTYFKQALAIG